MSALPIVSPAAASAGLALPAGLPGPVAAAVWRGDAQGAREDTVLPSGLAALDAVLPGGGWPVGALVELLQARPQQHVWRLLAPALAQAVRAQDGPVVLVAPPHPAFVPGLAARGLPASRLLWVKADGMPSRLWAAEQALRCAEAAAVLAWLPQAQGPQLRRLHLAAQQHRRLLFVMRPQSAQGQASPARLRLRLEPGEPLKVHVVKRRGTPLASPVLLPAQHELLAQLLQARQGDATPAGQAVQADFPLEGGHGLDRLAAPA